MFKEVDDSLACFTLAFQHYFPSSVFWRKVACQAAFLLININGIASSLKRFIVRTTIGLSFIR
jgi:hypothetical protein